MPVDFKFVPLAPEPIDGPSVLDQIERGFNELGEKIDTDVSDIREIAEEALANSQAAINTANQASSLATEALAAANAASEKADGYQAQIDQANATANNALSVATSASDNAQIALDRSAQAVQTATEAQTAANNALTAATTAEQNSESAIQTAQDAIEIARSASDIYTVNADNGLDADTYYDNPARVYPTGTGLLNFPLANGPFFFEVAITDDGLEVIQTVRSTDAKSLWRRCASVVYPEPPEDPEDPLPPPEITWTPWEVGSSEDIGWLPLYFAEGQTEPTRSMIPTGYTKASIQSIDSDEDTSAIVLTAEPTFSTGASITIPASPATVDVSTLEGKGTNFAISGLGAGATGAALLIRLEP